MARRDLLLTRGSSMQTVERESTEGVGRELHTARLLMLFAGLSGLTLFVFALVLARGHFSEWRLIQGRYNSLAAQSRLPPIDTGIFQIWKPELGAADRCVTCHLGAHVAKPVPGARLFAAHPPVAHDAATAGCTACHGGQGRATTARAAHGAVAHWEDPLIPKPYYEAGCGGCHTHLKLSHAGKATRGRQLFEQKGCLSCHTLDGAGTSQPGSPDLSRVGHNGPAAGWHDLHVRLSETARESSKFRFKPLAGADVEAIGEFLREKVGAPKLMAGKAVAHRLGCRGCHKVNGVGGDLAPDLSQEGRRRPADLDFSSVSGPRLLPSWLVAHFKNPSRVVPGSAMPDLAISDADADALTYYMLSLRRLDLPQALWPRDRVRSERLGEREFAVDGESLYAVFCAACHGLRGEGRRFGPQVETFPAIGGADFLALASNRFLARTIAQGRPGRKMPAWGAKEGGLRPGEVDSIVAHLRTLPGTARAEKEVLAATGNRLVGDRLYARECAVCHGSRGEGALGPSLAAPALAALADDRFLASTIVNGRPDTAMGSFGKYSATDLASLVSTVRSFWPATRPTVTLPPLSGGSAEAGRAVYSRSCAACHGREGAGGPAPQLANRAFLDLASDTFLAGSFRLGRCRVPAVVDLLFGAGQTPPRLVPPSVDDRETADVVAHVRQWQLRPPSFVARQQLQGDRARGAELFRQTCAGCHGERGDGKLAPAIANETFLESASDGYLVATILRGRSQTAMPHFGRGSVGYPSLTAAEALDLVAHLRSFEPAGSAVASTPRHESSDPTSGSVTPR
ncbi:MAG: c-type cytochrome [Candidatus Riflebacteria bacterium]|nr:c-type cytochrome [Candidatus Riflebacteria bacterium]